MDCDVCLKTDTGDYDRYLERLSGYLFVKLQRELNDELSVAFIKLVYSLDWTV